MIPCLTEFKSLTVLRIVGCTIKKIVNLDILVNLKELWLCEGKIQVDNFNVKTFSFQAF